MMRSTVFPPTTGIGIALGLTYNAAATAYDISEAYDSDTLRPSHAVDVGLLFLDVLPVIGKGVSVFTAAGRTASVIDTASGTYKLLHVSNLYMRRRSVRIGDLSHHLSGGRQRHA